MKKSMKTEKKTAGSKFVAVTAYYWGRGDTVDEAVANMKAAGGRSEIKKYGYIVKQLPEGATDAGVSDFGGLVWTWKDDADRNGQPVTVLDKRTKLAKGAA